MRTPAALNASSCADLTASGSGLPKRYRRKYGANRLGPAESALAESTSGFRSLIWFRSINSRLQLGLLGERADVFDLIVTKVERRQLVDLFERRQVLDLILGHRQCP